MFPCFIHSSLWKEDRFLSLGDEDRMKAPNLELTHLQKTKIQPRLQMADSREKMFTPRPPH